MGFYRKKPVEIEAHKFDGSSTSAGQIHNWMETGVWKDSEIHTRDCGRTVEIKTPEGVVVASAGDYVIKGVAGEFYPCKSEIFHATYDPLEDTDREPGNYPAKAIRKGDEIMFCGKVYTVTNTGAMGEDVILTLVDGSQIPVRPDTQIIVTKAQ
ncbi:hypothetical protein NDO71_orf103 [Klebsiella phage vB_KpnM_NDO71]|nr:hypothetical protein NDO71_orf103 [Klebsiella phage vB_KpnM_NDO71]